MIHVGELASAYLDGETTETESVQLVRHLDTCLACQREMADLHAARSALRSLPVLEMPADLIAEFDLDAEVIPLRRRPVAWVGAAAAAFFIFVGTATALTPDPVGVSLVDVSNQYEQVKLVDGGLSPVVGLVPSEVSE